MPATMADIAKRAFDKVQAKVSDVIQPCTLTRPGVGTYDTTTGQVTPGTAQTTGGRIIFASENFRSQGAGVGEAGDLFPQYEIGPLDELIYLEGLSFEPEEADVLTVGTDSYLIQVIRDVAHAGAVYVGVARRQ